MTTFTPRITLISTLIKLLDSSVVGLATLINMHLMVLKVASSGYLVEELSWVGLLLSHRLANC